MGSRSKPRPDGKPFNPYVLTDEELAGVETLLKKQKGLLLTRYQDNPTLFQLLQSGAVVAAVEFAQVFRQLLNAKDGVPSRRFPAYAAAERRRSWLGRHLAA